MKILHCCLAAFYIDNFSYQENILPKIHKKQGHDVKILASTENYINNMFLGYEEPKEYLNENGIIVRRIPYIKWLPLAIAKKLRIYNGIIDYIKEFKPDIIYLHDCQFLSIDIIARYAKEYQVKIIVDTHTDFINSGKNWVSKNILHKIIYKWCAKRIEKYTTKFFATLPVRATFLEEVYGIDPNKIELLPFGADDSLFDADKKNEIKAETRALVGLNPQDFVIVCGGKIDRRKNIHLLLKAFIEIQDEFNFKDVKLLIFGKPVEDLKEIIENYTQHKDVKYLSWANANDIHKYLLASDLAFFPGTHSVLWEEAIGLGLPAIFKRWNGITHVDLGGNCVFLQNSEEQTVKATLLTLFKGDLDFVAMKTVAQELGPKRFSYSNIAKQAIDI